MKTWGAFEALYYNSSFFGEHLTSTPLKEFQRKFGCEPERIAAAAKEPRGRK
jgi:hypothetical protein